MAVSGKKPKSKKKEKATQFRCIFYKLPMAPLGQNGQMSKEDTALYEDLRLVVFEINKLRGVVATFDTFNGGVRWPTKQRLLTALGSDDLTLGFTHCLFILGSSPVAMEVLFRSEAYCLHWYPMITKFARAELGGELPVPVSSMLDQPLLHIHGVKLSTRKPALATAIGDMIDECAHLPGVKIGFAEATPSPARAVNTKESKDTLGLTHCVMVAADDALSLRTCLHRPKWAEALGGGGAGSVGAGSGQFSFDLELRFEHDAMVLKQRLKDYPSLQEAEDEGAVIEEDDADDPMMRIFLVGAVLAVLVAYWLSIFWAKYATHPSDEPDDPALTGERHQEVLTAGMHT